MRPTQCVHVLPAFLKPSSDLNPGGSSIRGLGCSSSSTRTRTRRAAMVTPALGTSFSGSMLQPQAFRPGQHAGVCHAAPSSKGEGGEQQESGGKGVVSGLGAKCEQSEMDDGPQGMGHEEL